MALRSIDLMIGDWVKIQDSFARVLSIAEDGIFFKDCISEGDCSMDKLEPIPITPEILEKNGFYYEKTYDVWILEYREIIIEVGIYHPDFINISYRQITPDYTSEGDISSICKVDGSDIMTHELQHALRLCGIEKEIEL